MECFRLLLEHLTWINHQFLSGIRDSRKVGSLWGMMRGVRKSRDQSWLAKVLGLGLLCWGFQGRDSLGRGQHSSNRVSGISTGQYTSRQVHPCPRLFDQDEHQDSSSVVGTFLLVTFGYSLTSEAVVMRQLRWKRQWRRSLIHSRKKSGNLSYSPRIYLYLHVLRSSHMSVRITIRLISPFFPFPSEYCAHHIKLSFF